MKNEYKVMTRSNRSVGEVSSKYGYDKDGKLFEADIKAHHERQEFLWNEFMSFMKSNNVNPPEIRTMFTRYYEEFLKG
jgi:hypothetical protein